MNSINRCLFFTFVLAFYLALVTPDIDPLTTIAKGEVLFAHSLYKQISKSQKGNLVTCPLSAHAVLSMAALGAGGQTAHEMKKSLQLPNDDTLAKNGLKTFIAGLDNVQGATLNIANRIVVSQEFKLSPNYKKTIDKIFHSDVIEADFNKADEVVKNVNEWCSSKTNDKINNLLSRDDIQPESMMILLNAVYLKSNWEKKFDPSETRNRNFYVNAKTVKQVPMMIAASRKFHHGRLDNLGAEFVVLPYANNDLKLIVVVPDEVDGLELIEQNIGREEKVSINNLNKNALAENIEGSIDLLLPKFKIESSIDLKEPLQNIGMTTMFSDNANFSGMTRAKSLSVGKVIQKAFIEVNEEGSEATTATGLEIEWRNARKVIRVDKPFYYMIQSSQARIFQGRVIDPSL